MEREDGVVVLRVHFVGDEGITLSSGRLVWVMRACDRAVLEYTRAELREIRREHPEIPAVAVDAALFRLQDLDGYGVRVNSAGAGSIWLTAAMGGLTIFLLERTIGETVGEAWKESEAHKALKRYLLKATDEGYQVLADMIERQLWRRLRDGRSVTIRSEEGRLTLEVEVPADAVEQDIAEAERQRRTPTRARQPE